VPLNIKKLVKQVKVAMITINVISRLAFLFPFLIERSVKTNNVDIIIITPKKQD